MKRKVIVITGATVRVGAAAARCLASAGRQVVSRNIDESATFR